MTIQYHAKVSSIQPIKGYSRVDLSVERNNISAWSTLFVDEQTLKDENIQVDDKLIINLDKKINY